MTHLEARHSSQNLPRRTQPTSPGIVLTGEPALASPISPRADREVRIVTDALALCEALHVRYQEGRAAYWQS